MPITFDGTDLDASASEVGVVHESVANTDHDDANALKQGYPLASPLHATNLDGYWPLHEDSGTTANDFSGNGNDGTVSGATQGVTGILGTSAYDFDGADDFVGLPSMSNTSALTFDAWANLDAASIDSGAVETIISSDDNNRARIKFDDSNHNNKWAFQINASSNVDIGSTTTATAGEWTHIAGAWDGSTMRLYVDANEENTGSQSGSGTGGNSDAIGALRQDQTQPFDGQIAYAARWAGRALTASEIQTRYDVVDAAGELITATKVS